MKTESSLERIIRLSDSSPYVSNDLALAVVAHIEGALDEMDKVELSLRRVKTPEGVKKYGEPIGSVIGSVGSSLAEQPKGFDLKNLPEGSKITSRVSGAKPYTKQGSGSWKHESGVEVSPQHFEKFGRTHELSQLPNPVTDRKGMRTSVVQIKEKLNKGLPIAKAEIYELARKFGELDPEETLTKKDFVEHFIHEYLIGGGAAGVHGG